jgi:hypothetical protein
MFTKSVLVAIVAGAVGGLLGIVIAKRVPAIGRVVGL